MIHSILSKEIEVNNRYSAAKFGTNGFTRWSSNQHYGDKGRIRTFTAALIV